MTTRPTPFLVAADIFEGLRHARAQDLQRRCPFCSEPATVDDVEGEGADRVFVLQPCGHQIGLLPR